MSQATVVAELERGTSARLACSTSPTLANPIFSPSVAVSEGRAKMTATGLAADTAYHYGVEVDGVLHREFTGTFKTKPAGAASFKICFGTCASTGSNHAVFEAIEDAAPLAFFHIGDAHYENISTDSEATFHAAYDSIFGAARQASLYRNVCWHYIFDDHDYGDNDSDGSSASREACLTAYRKRVPNELMIETGTTDPVYYLVEIGRCVFIVTDLRSESSANGATDDASKTMMGATQKAWFKSVLSDPSYSDRLFVWCNSRIWIASGAGADHWGSYSTERTELADYIKANCPGRVCILTGDRHQLGIDDGTNSDYATGGGAPIPVFMAAPLDRTENTHGGGTFSEGVNYTNGQFGIMEVTDAGGDITVDWTGEDSVGTEIMALQFVVDVTP